MRQALTDVRPSPIAGQWYPGSSASLTSTIDTYIKAAQPPPIEGEIIGLVAPHAGYVYSGPTAAHAFKLVQGRSYDRVVVISPMHHVYPHAVLTTGHEAYSTPFGPIPVDRAALDLLEQQMPINPTRRDPEHSLEIELPFLQHVLSAEFSLVPLMLRDQSFALADKLGKALAEVIRQDGKSTLLVASSDLSHFYTEEQARRLDRLMLDQIESFDPEAVIRVEDEGKAFACGRAAIATMLVAARALGANRARIVGYGTSADATGDTHRVVGYGAAAVYQA